MIVNFRPVDMDTFCGQFNEHVIHIQRTPDNTNNWRLFINGRPTKNEPFPSIHQAKDYVEKIASRLIRQAMNGASK